MSTRPPIEGDGIRVNFFHLLLRSPGDVSPPPRVAIPDTIVFEHNCPRSWYFYDVESREIRKRAGRDLQAGTILAEFSVPTHGVASGSTVPGTSISTVATFTYLRQNDGDSATPSITTLYLTRETLEKLLITTSPLRQEGILQKYLLPLEANECVIQTTWVPKLCVVRRRMNGRPVTDRPRLLAEKHATFDGPDHLSIEVATAKDTVVEITQLCDSIAEHVSKSMRLRTVSMMLYFKLDQHRRPRLMWCSSLRFEGHRFVTPPPAVFVCPELESNDQLIDEEELNELSEAQDRLERRSRQNSPERGESRSPSPSRQMSVTSAHVERRPGHHIGGAPTKGAQLRVVPPDVASDIERLCSQWHLVHDDINDEYEVIKEQQAAASQMVDDVLYTVHTAFQQQDPHDAVVRFPPELLLLLGGVEVLHEMFRTMGVATLPTGEVVIPSPKSATSGPSTTVMMSMAKQWLDRHFARRLAPSLERAAVHVQWAAVQRAIKRL